MTQSEIATAKGTRFASKIGNTDWQVLIETFKSNYCSGCSARSPKDDSMPPS